MLKKISFAGLKGDFDWDAKIIVLRHVSPNLKPT